MFKKYIRGIVRSELQGEELRLFYDTMMAENYWKQVYHNQLDYNEKIINKKDKEIEELKDLYEQEKNKNYKTLELDELKQENEKLKESIEKLEGKLISKCNLLSEQKEENKHLKITLKLSKNKILELKDLYEQEKNKNYKTLESEELKKENEQLKDILNEIHEICVSSWGDPLPYFEVRSLLNKIRVISKIG